MKSCTPSARTPLFAGSTLLIAALVSCAPACAQTPQAHAQPDITTLLNTGYTIAAASSDGASQFVYLQGADATGRKKAYACQLQFGSNGGFRGCLALP